MSPEMKRDFEAEWPLLARRLRHFMVRKNVADGVAEDLIQETALRLFKMWGEVDRSRPAWSLTVTIALNLMRDELRRGRPEIVAELPDIAAACDVESAGIARVELQRVRSALSEMTPAQRAVLLAEVGQPAAANGAGGGDKMRRLRARRKLAQLLERVSAAFVLPARRISESVQVALGMRDSLAGGLSCVLCVVLGLGLGSPLPAMSSPSDAVVVDRLPADVTGPATSGAAAIARPVAVAVDEGALLRSAAQRRVARAARAAEQGSGSDTTTSTKPSSSSKTVLPGDGVPLPGPGDPPALPGGDGDGIPTPPAPPPPPLPAPPSQDEPGDQPLDPDEVVTTVESKAAGLLQR